MTPSTGVFRINGYNSVRRINSKRPGGAVKFTYDLAPTGTLTHTPKITLSGGSGTIDWGDGSAAGVITSGVAMSHVYSAGSYTVIIDCPELVTALEIAISNEYVKRVDDIGICAKWKWGAQGVSIGGDVSEPYGGSFVIMADIVRATG